MCFNGCGVIVETEKGKPVSLRGDPEHPLSKGKLCRRGRTALELLNHPDRLRLPQRRTGPRGSGAWTEIGWDEALDAAVQGLTSIARKQGAEAVAFVRGGSKGTSDDLLTRLAHIFGSPNVSTTASICYSSSFLASKHTYGFWAYPDLSHGTRCVILWGANPKATHHPLYREVRQAVAGGAKLITIDPGATSANDTFALRIRPGTDGALALAMANCILEENLHDAAFVAQWTVGLERLRRHLTPYSPEIVQEETWIPAGTIREVARLYASVRPGCIVWGNALESGPDNYQTSRSICILRAITGNLGVPGSDIMHADSSELRRRSPGLTRPDLVSPEMQKKHLGKLAGFLPDFTQVPHHIVAKAILENDPYPVRGMYLQGGNLLSTGVDSAYMKQALSKLDFLAATDHFMTPTTALADIVFPASMYLEEEGAEQPWYWPAAFALDRAVDPGQTRSEGCIANDLAKRLPRGGEAFPDMAAFWNFYLQPSGLHLDQFKEKGVLLAPGLPMAHESNGFPTPSGKVELYSETLEQWGFAPLPVHVPPSATSERYPLVLSSKKSPVFYHSCGRHTVSLREASRGPVALIHPETAREIGLAEGDTALISTPRGQIRQQIRFDERLDPRLVFAEHGWWFPEQGPEAGESPGYGWQQANLNMLTDALGPRGRELGSPALRGFPCRVDQEKNLLSKQESP